MQNTDVIMLIQFLQLSPLDIFIISASLLNENWADVESMLVRESFFLSLLHFNSVPFVSIGFIF